MVKKNKKIVAIVQARLTSKRFPNKVIKKIGKLRSYIKEFLIQYKYLD